MGNIVNHLSIRAKLAVIGLAAVIGVAAVAITSMFYLDQTLLADRQIKTKHTVQTAYSVVEYFHRRVVHGELTPEQGRRQALQILKTLRYGDDNYFWVNDMQPNMVMHPFEPELDGEDMSKVEDPTGKRLFTAFVEQVQDAGEGFVEY